MKQIKERHKPDWKYPGSSIAFNIIENICKQKQILFFAMTNLQTNCLEVGL